jgi:hypothetical protein
MTIGNKITVTFLSSIVGYFPIILFLVLIWIGMGLSTTFLVASSFKQNIYLYLLANPEYKDVAQEYASNIALASGVSLAILLEGGAFLFVIHNWRIMSWVAAFISGSIAALGMLKNLPTDIYIFTDITSFSKVAILLVFALAVPTYSVNFAEMLNEQLDREIAELGNKSVKQVMQEYIAIQLIAALGIAKTTKKGRFTRRDTIQTPQAASTVTPYFSIKTA